MEYNSLQHHGVKGMRWGVRRYQNKDGSLTAAGKKRMYREMFDNESKEKKERRKYTAEPDRWVTEDTQRTRSLVDNSTQLARNLRTSNSNAMRRQQQNTKKMDLSKMSDKEMRDRINRALLERQYEQMFNPPTVSKGRQRAERVLEVAGDTLAVTGSALAVALSVRALMGKG